MNPVVAVERQVRADPGPLAANFAPEPGLSRARNDHCIHIYQMGRTKRVGLDYFPFDIDFFQDIRIRKLIRRHGGNAVTVYAQLLCQIYRGGYYIAWDEELPFILSEQSGFEEDYIAEVIRCCIEVGLFSRELFESAGVLSSRGIQERYHRICRQCRRSCDITDHRLIPDADADADADAAGPEHDVSSEEKAVAPEEKAVASEEKAVSPEESAQSKVKQIKEKLQENNAARYLARGGFLHDFLAANAASAAFGRTLAGLGLSADEFGQLAREVVDEWTVASKTHRDRSDAAQNLISAVRCKSRSRGEPGRLSERLREQRDRREREAERARREQEARLAPPPTTWEAFARSKGIDPSRVSAAAYAISGAGS